MGSNSARKRGTMEMIADLMSTTFMLADLKSSRNNHNNSTWHGPFLSPAYCLNFSIPHLSSCVVVRLFGGLILDIKRKAPFYLSDFKEGLSLQCVASFLFLYCACMSPVITFGGLLGEATEGRIVRAQSQLNTVLISCSVFRASWIQHSMLLLHSMYGNQDILSAFQLFFLECNRVLIRGLYDWSGLLSVCWSASHYSGQHWPCAGFWKMMMDL